jgi:hypothetical protein
MPGQGPRFAALLLAMTATFAGAVATAASSKSVTYRWVDDQGVVHYGDRVPPQYAQKEHTELNSQGVELKRLDRQKSPDEMTADARRDEAIAHQKQHDSFLLTTYTSVNDIEALRDERLMQLKTQRAAAEAYVESLHSRLSALQARAMFFRPYNARPGARRMPDDLTEDLVRTLNEMRSQKAAMVAKVTEEAALRDQFQADIERYRQLHSVHDDR